MKNKNTIELMNMYAGILKELNERDVVRTYNSPVGDYAEWLVAKKMKLTLAKNSKKGFDAEDTVTGRRYQIKARWERGKVSTKSRELSVLRDLDNNDFDDLVVVIFDELFAVKEAYIIPRDIISAYARYNKHQNGHVLIAMGDVLKDGLVTNIVDILK